MKNAEVLFKKKNSLTFFRTGARGLIQQRKRKTEVGSNALSPILKMITIQQLLYERGNTPGGVSYIYYTLHFCKALLRTKTRMRSDWCPKTKQWPSLFYLFTCSVTQVRNIPSSQCPLGLPTSPHSLHFLWKLKSNLLSTQPPNKTCLSKEQLSHPPPFTDPLSEEWWFLHRKKKKKGRGKNVCYFFMRYFGFVLSPGLYSLERSSQNKYVRGACNVAPEETNETQDTT